MFRIAATLIICSTITLAGCPWSKKVQPTTEPGQFYGTHLFVNYCRTQVERFDESQSVEIIAPLVGSVASTALSRLGKALAKAGDEDVKKTWAYTNLASLKSLSGSGTSSGGSGPDFIGFNSPPGNASQPHSSEPKASIENITNSSPSNPLLCVQVVRGLFQFSSELAGDVYGTRMGDALIYPASLEIVEGKEDLFIELLPASTSNVISFVPLTVRYSGYAVEDDGDEGPRELALYVGYAFPEKDISTGELSGRLITFDTLYPDENGRAHLSYVDPKSNRAALLDHTQWLAVPNVEAMNKPVTLGVKVIETRDGNSMAKFLAEAFKASEEELKTSVESAVEGLEFLKSSETLKDEQITAGEAAIENEGDYLTAIGEVYTKETALVELCVGDDATETAIYTAYSELYIAKKTANMKATIVGKPMPYPKLKAAEEEVKTKCS